MAGPGEVVPTFSRTGERAEPAPKHPQLYAKRVWIPSEGQRQDRAAIADRVATYGLRVFCTDCGLMHRHRTIGGDRLRNVPSACCGARMRKAKWEGWPGWRSGPRELRRQEPEPLPDRYVVRRGGKYYMRGLDS